MFLFQCSSGVDFSNDEYLDTTNTDDKDAGLAICCNSASASSREFQLVDGDEATMSFYVRTCTGCHGIIFSYTKKKPFSLDYINGKLELSYGKDKTWKTDIAIKDNVWYQMVLTWSNRLKKIQLYVFEENGTNNPQLYSAKLKKNPFKKGGYLSLGKFQISPEEKKWKKTDNFVGCFDAVGFATRYV